MRRRPPAWPSHVDERPRLAKDLVSGGKPARGVGGARPRLRQIAPLALALNEGLDVRALAEVAFPHPMISEGINKVARQVIV